MGKNKLLTLVEQLRQKGIDGKLDWEQTDREGVFQITLPKYSIRISSRPSQEHPDAIDIFISIFNEEGNLIVKIADYELSSESEDAYRIFKETYNNARQKAMGIDRALNEILEFLGNDEDDFPFDVENITL